MTIKPPNSFPPANTRYRAIHTSGMRHASDIDYIVIHATEGSTGEGAAHWFTNPASGGSANMVVDDWITYKTLADLVIPWAAPPLNTNGFHIEIVGFSHWTRQEWLHHERRIFQAAYRAAMRSIWYTIPLHFCTVDDLKQKKHGITSHWNVSKAFHLSDHTDPGSDFPWDFFMEYTNYYVKQFREKV